MILSTTITLSLAAFAVALPQAVTTPAVPPKAQLITSCTVPGTVALTFVSIVDMILMCDGFNRVLSG
jgi:hypothetical protein